MKLHKLLVVSVILAILTIGAVSASDENVTDELTEIEDLSVESFDDEILNTNGSMGTFSDLSDLIESASAGDVLELDKDYQNGGSVSGYGITISKKMTIDGKGHTLDAGLNSRIFNIAADKVTLKNIVFKNGNFNKGGAVYFNGAGEITNCNFTNNYATSSGSAVYFNGAGEITNCNFTNNCAASGGAVYMKSGEVTYCNFTNNLATSYGGGGGAIYFRVYGEVTYCNFTDNKATGDEGCGGAVYFYNEGNVSNCNFTNNLAYGGAVFFYENGNVTNCNFTNNTSSTGGAIYFMDTGEVTNCNFVNNSASKIGGAVYFYDNGIVTNCNFTNNRATSSGGAVFFRDNGEVTNCNFTNNQATGYGGAIYFNKLSSVNKCIFNGNSDPEIYPIPEPISNTTENSTTVPEINIPSLDEPSADGTVTVTLPADATGTLTLTVGGKDYNFDVIEGKANVKLPDLGDGDYPYTITYSGDSKYSSFTTDGNLKVNKTSVNPIDNKTDNNTTENNTPQENTTVVDNSKIVASNVNVVYSAGSYYTITVYGTNGELADGETVKVTGKISKSLTTTNGVAKFKVTQVPGTYMITISALGKSVSKTVTVKKATAKLTAKAKTFKKSVKTKNYVVTFKTNQNKVMKKAKLTLKVNGKTYSATTNAKGQATFKITKLTKKGKFTGTIAYKGNAYYNKLSKKVQITIK